MKNYPWLKNTYSNIINYYKSKYKKNTILISSTIDLGINILSYNIGKWILCSNKKKINYCNQCINCILMQQKNNPNYYKITTNNKNKKINKKEINTIFNNIYNLIENNYKKIVFIEEIEYFKKYINNTFIDHLIKPQKNTYFILNTNNLINIKKQINNKITIWKIINPNKKICIDWIQKKTKIKKKKCSIALKLSEKSPLKALNILNKKYWENRKKLEIKLIKILNKENKLDLLTNLNNLENIEIIKWICAILMDAIKWKYKAYDIIINNDQYTLIKTLSKNLSIFSIYKSIKIWIKYINLFEINTVNKKSTLITSILNWENFLLKNKKINKYINN
ncbi:hypothetical protein ONB69_00730 [Candidatus Purcelliella pentastirinorum]|uniref:DNA polymerase III subunit delta' C-terminal domain-containing protein n=1 Tax=Candidatus Purcelliella pentastirinorum TaxID=472834 RepID=UPI00236888EF|nr:DNA polymerase III subunit delta' C-terminal domain-containing protein [Candidatus Purcelliella pentastirinorum]WDI79074.1 hypothetical protein ONB68_00765 [Candidatus Purcelliella pentastirinorum]WDR80212.1 hypothetical protein ONB69_00730 [Candidatus Purcelliella pentastirinorum]